ncbi:hypothetical protein FB451DRAFT_1434075 [Mycena latifolia]|nr:hypothetical protein FB451DRAFT_1434075 [Mycena latifolia]
MAPRIHEIQTYLISSIQEETYRPIEPPTKTIIFSISRMQRERLEIYGDALLGQKLISYLFHEFPTKGAGFISSVKAALLSNHIFTNIFLKAKGYSDPKGFPLDKAVADAFETMAALSYEEGPKKFEVWFCETFIPLVNAAVSLYNREDDGAVSNAGSSTSLTAPQSSGPSAATEGISITPKSWVESCIEVAAFAADPIPAPSPPCTEIPRRRRRREDAPEEQPLPRDGGLKLWNSQDIKMVRPA